MVSNIYFCLELIVNLLVAKDETPVKGPRHGVNVGNAVNLAAHSSCRQFIEQFKKDFVVRHSEFQASGKCTHSFVNDASVSSVLNHFEVCPGVTSRKDVLLGDELNAELTNMNIQAPSAGSFRSLYQDLSECIHNCNWFKDDFNCVIIPNDLDIVQKRFIIRFLLAKGLLCVIATHDGGVRDPTSDEITTPDKSKKAKTK